MPVLAPYAVKNLPSEGIDPEPARGANPRAGFFVPPHGLT